MSYLSKKALLAGALILPTLMALAGCEGDRREHVRPHEDRYPERYERHDDRRHEEQRDSGRHEERPGHDRGDHDGR